MLRVTKIEVSGIEVNRKLKRSYVKYIYWTFPEKKDKIFTIDRKYSDFEFREDNDKVYLDIIFKEPYIVINKKKVPIPIDRINRDGTVQGKFAGIVLDDDTPEDFKILNLGI